MAKKDIVTQSIAKLSPIYSMPWR